MVYSVENKLYAIPCFLVLEPNNKKFFEISEGFEWMLSDGNIIFIPKGFRFDGSSVPGILTPLMPKFGCFMMAALVHDFLYVTDYRRLELGFKKSKKFADDEMLLISKAYNPNNLDNYTRYIGVRLFGGKVYKRWMTQ